MKSSISLILVSLILGISSLNAQNEQVTKENPIDKLSFMIGEWEGSGWSMTREGKSTTDMKETVECKVGCSLLVVQGLGTKIDSVTGEQKTVHDAFATITYDAAEDVFTMTAYNENGVTETILELTEEKVVSWGMDTPNGGKVRFTADFSTKDKWVEKGEFTRVGGNWAVFMGTDLTRVK